MKVLHLCAGNLFGGIETYLLTLVKGQMMVPQMHHEFALCFEGRLATDLQSLGATVHQLGAVRTRQIWSIWQARSNLRALLQQQAFDLVVCHACWTQAIFGTVVKQQKLPLVFACHDALTGQHWLEQWAKWTLPDLCLANSFYTQTSLATVYPNTPSHVVYLPVFSTAQAEKSVVRDQVRSQMQTPNDRVVIIQACRLEPWKGHRVLLSAFGELKNIPNWEVWIAGGVQRSQEAEYLADLRSQASQLGIRDRVKFLGQRSDVPRLLAAADIHCQPNTGAEPFGIAFVEALYAGLPVVTSAIGGATEIVDQTCGILVPPGDPRGTAQALEQLITNSKERDRLAQGGVDRADLLCNPNQQLTKLYQILNQAISGAMELNPSRRVA